MSSADADLLLLETAQKCDFYGIKLHVAKVNFKLKKIIIFFRILKELMLHYLLYIWALKYFINLVVFQHFHGQKYES